MVKKAETEEDFIRKAVKGHITRYYPREQHSLMTISPHKDVFTTESVPRTFKGWVCFVHDAKLKSTSMWRGYLDRRGYMITVLVRRGPYKTLIYRPRTPGVVKCVIARP
jgi:hypothetical protein